MISVFVRNCWRNFTKASHSWMTSYKVCSVTSQTAQTAAQSFQSLSTTTLTVQSKNRSEPSPSLRKIHVTGIAMTEPKSERRQPMRMSRMNTKPSSPATSMSSSSGALKIPMAHAPMPGNCDESPRPGW